MAFFADRPDPRPAAPRGRPGFTRGGSKAAATRYIDYSLGAAMANLYQRLLGNPFVYNRVRPLAVGGLDMSPFYRRVQARADSVVLDVGCGTGDALRYLERYQTYFGIDTDPVAIGFAQQQYGARPQVSFDCRLCDDDDVRRLQPTEVLLCGVLHHLPDDAAKGLLRLAASSPRLRRVVTSDIVYLHGEPVSNLFARLDRGRFCRRAYEYVALAEAAGLKVAESEVVRCHPRTGLAKYWMMSLELREPAVQSASGDRSQ